MPFADRKNVFYEITNFYKNEYDIFKFKLNQKASITVDDIEKVEKKHSEYYTGFEIEITLNELGRIKFEKITQKNINKPIAIVIDKKIIITRIVTSKITEGKVVISGQLSESKVNELIQKLEKK